MSFDFAAGVQLPHRMQPGLRRLAPGALQLTPAAEPNRGVSRHLREKLAVLGAFRNQALLSSPGFDAGPVLQALAAHAATYRGLTETRPALLRWLARRAADPPGATA